MGRFYSGKQFYPIYSACIGHLTRVSIYTWQHPGIKESHWVALDDKKLSGGFLNYLYKTLSKLLLLI